jgi:hypothetical protein
LTVRVDAWRTGFPLPSCAWIVIEPEDVPGLPATVVNVCAALKNTRAPPEFVSLNGGAERVPSVALTAYEPTVEPAVNVNAEAIPFTFVTAVQVCTTVPDPAHAPPAANIVPLLLPVGLMNVTVSPDTGFPPESVTSTDNGLANAVPVFADWLFPLQIDMCAAAPVVTVVVAVADERPAAEAVKVYGFALALE